MAKFHGKDTMPKIGHVTDLREQWLVRTDGALANRLQDHEISSHLCENRYRNQLIREDFPVALNEQRGIENEARIKELARQRQANMDEEIAREIAEINLRRQRRHNSTDLLQQPSSSRAGALMPLPEPKIVPASLCNNELDPKELGLSPIELEEIKRRMEQEERDARLARELSHEGQDQDVLLADLKCAVEAQDGELARLLQEREYKKLQRAKEKARQKALLKKQQRLAAQQLKEFPELQVPQATLCDAYSNPRDMIRGNGLRLCKSVDSDLNYVEPFEKEQIQSKASALQAKEVSKQYCLQQASGICDTDIFAIKQSTSFENNNPSNFESPVQHRQPPPPPVIGKKPRFPDPVSIRPASHYPTDEINPDKNINITNIPHSYSENNNLYGTTYSQQDDSILQVGIDRNDNSKRMSVVSEITAEGLAKKKNKQDLQKKKKGCKIQ